MEIRDYCHLFGGSHSLRKVVEVNDVMARGFLEYKACGSGEPLELGFIIHTKHISHITLADMRILMNPGCDAGGSSSVFRPVSLADESFPRSGGGDMI